MCVCVCVCVYIYICIYINLLPSPPAKALSHALDIHFPLESGVRIIAEPGRFFVSSAVRIAVNIVSRRVLKGEDNGKNAYMYYVNDGVYGSFNCIMFDHQICTPYSIINKKNPSATFHSRYDVTNPSAITSLSPLL